MLTPGAMKQSWGLQWDWPPRRISKRALQDYRYSSALQPSFGQLQWLESGCLSVPSWQGGEGQLRN
jgi:hypothetical protein